MDAHSGSSGASRRRGVPGLQALSGRVSGDLGTLSQSLRALPDAVSYLRKLSESIDSVAEDTARMRAATERLEEEVVALNEKFAAVEASVHDLATALRPIRTRRRARAKEASEANGDEKDDSDDPHAPPTPEGS